MKSKKQVIQKEQKNRNLKQGFTLLELLIVVLIIGILAAITIPQYKRAVEKAKMAEAVIIVKSIAQAQQRYYLLHNTYLDCQGMDALDIDLTASSNCSYHGNLNCICRQAKNFLYMTSTSSTNNVIARAVRTPYPYKYYLNVNKSNPDKVTCGYTGNLGYQPTQIQKELCDKLKQTGSL